MVSKGQNEKEKSHIESTVRATVDMPKNLHKAVKRLLIDEELSMKDYLISLMEKDLRSRKYKF